MCGEKRFVNNYDVFGVGITPACAGKSALALLQSGQLQDHPRMCGEKRPETLLRSTSMGSPPHVRGKALRVSVAASTARITPACAGKRPIFSKKEGARGDHPRMCGEKTKKIP